VSGRTSSVRQTIGMTPVNVTVKRQTMLVFLAEVCGVI
jgi:hypothetical protein